MSDPLDALLVIVTTTSSTGVVLGLVAWGTMIILGLTSFFRKSLPMSYKTWRKLHGILATIFLATATWHAVSLGRHANTSMTVVLLLLAGSGIYLWVSSLFLLHRIKEKSSNEPNTQAIRYIKKAVYDGCWGHGGSYGFILCWSLSREK